MIIIEHRYTTEDARNLTQGGLEQCVDTMAAIFAALPELQLRLLGLRVLLGIRVPYATLGWSAAFDNDPSSGRPM